MVKSSKNVFPYDAERSNSRLINHIEIQHHIAPALTLLGEEKWGCNNFKWSNLYLPKFLVFLHLKSNFLNKEL